MSAWEYCPKCDMQLDKPSVREAMEGERTCSSCGHTFDVRSYTPAEAVEDMNEQLQDALLRIHELEKQLKSVLEILSTPVSAPNA